MKELLEKVYNKYEQMEIVTQAQVRQIEGLLAEKKQQSQEIAKLNGQIIELQGRWKKIKGLLKGVNADGG